MNYSENNGCGREYGDGYGYGKVKYSEGYSGYGYGHIIDYGSKGGCGDRYKSFYTKEEYKERYKNVSGYGHKTGSGTGSGRFNKKTFNFAVF